MDERYQDDRLRVGGAARLFEGGGAAALTAPLANLGAVHAGSSETIKVGLVGCGGRGRGAMVDSMDASKDVRIVAVADLFKDRINEVRNIAGRPRPADQGRELLPWIRRAPALAQAGSRLRDLCDAAPLSPDGTWRRPLPPARTSFMEKPVAVDPVGCRSVMASGDAASRKGCRSFPAPSAATKRRYLEMIKRVKDGQIGKVVGGQIYWNGGQLWYRNRESNWSPMEMMIRDWVNWSWLSGDHICEQHVHNIDVANGLWIRTRSARSEWAAAPAASRATSMITSPSTSIIPTPCMSPATPASQRPETATSANVRW